MTEPSEPTAATVRDLTAPQDGTPTVQTDSDSVSHLAAQLADGTGPVAVDAERASGYRYGQRAYLVQLRRAGVGTLLIDPTSTGDLSPLGSALTEAEWVLHAANQDLPCLAEVGLRPNHLFDTELAARLCGFDRVGLAAVTEHLLGLRLAKEHSAADWSKRPLPDSWLIYAALDVEVLIELRDALAAELEAQGKIDWAQQEFAAIVNAPPAAPRQDPWRRTSRIHTARGPRALAAVRELWYARDAVAQSLDTAPGRLLPDTAIMAAVSTRPIPASTAALLKVAGFQGRNAAAHAETWLAALHRAAALPPHELPTQHGPSTALPPPRTWPTKQPDAAARLAAIRTALAELSETHRVPVENLASPDAIRALAWEPPNPATPDSIAVALTASGARPWQVQLIVPKLPVLLGNH